MDSENKFWFCIVATIVAGVLVLVGVFTTYHAHKNSVILKALEHGVPAGDVYCLYDNGSASESCAVRRNNGR